MPAAYCFGVLWLLVLLWVTHNCIVSLGSKEVQGNSLAIDTEVACAFAALFVAFLTFVVYRDRRLEARACRRTWPHAKINWAPLRPKGSQSPPGRAMGH